MSYCINAEPSEPTLKEPGQTGEAMHEDDLQLMPRAKRRIQREAALRTFLVAGVAVAAAFRFADTVYLLCIDCCLLHWFWTQMWSPI